MRINMDDIKIEVDTGWKLKDTIKVLTREHRTNQQSLTAFCVAWLEQLAESYEAGAYDLRNQASCELGAEFVKAIPVEKRRLPFI